MCSRLVGGWRQWLNADRSKDEDRKESAERGYGSAGRVAALTERPRRCRTYRLSNLRVSRRLADARQRSAATESDGRTERGEDAQSPVRLVAASSATGRRRGR